MVSYPRMTTQKKLVLGGLIVFMPDYLFAVFSVCLLRHTEVADI